MRIKSAVPLRFITQKRLNVPPPYAAHPGLTASARECTSPGASLRQLSADGRRSLSVAVPGYSFGHSVFRMLYSNTAARKTQAIHPQYFMRRRGTRDCKRACAKKAPGTVSRRRRFSVIFLRHAFFHRALVTQRHNVRRIVKRRQRDFQNAAFRNRKRIGGVVRLVRRLRPLLVQRRRFIIRQQRRILGNRILRFQDRIPVRLPALLDALFRISTVSQQNTARKTARDHFIKSISCICLCFDL